MSATVLLLGWRGNRQRRYKLSKPETAQHARFAGRFGTTADKEVP